MVDPYWMVDRVANCANLPLGGVDASAIASAERLGVGQAATLDRRNFLVVRPASAGALTLLA